MIKLSDFVAKRLKEIYNVNQVFMVSGGGAMHLNDSFGKYIPYTCNHHEQACAIAAEGYARVNQDLAVVNITTGPGGLNCLNGVFGQWTDSVPVLYVSGQVKTSTMMSSYPEIPLRQLGDQEVDIISCVKPLTKYAVSLKDANDIEYVLDKAVYLATHGRKGPVWIDIPINLQAAMIDENKLRKYDSKEDNLVLSNIDNEINELIELLKLSKKPLIIAGHGIRLSGMKDEFSELVNKLCIPVVTTFNGFDLLETTNPYYVGRIGSIGQRAGNFALQNADLVLCLGSRNNIRQVSYNWENFAKNAKLVCVDIDKAELDKPLINPYLKINSDLKTFINKLKKEICECKREKWLEVCKNLQEKYLEETSPKTNKKDVIQPYFFTHTLTKCLKDENILVMANGSACVCTFQNAVVKKGQRFILNSGNASMGYALPASIGAQLASNARSVICLEGDGSIMMNLQELQTIKHYNLPIKIFVINNNGYSSIRQSQKNFFNGNMTGSGVESGVSVPNFSEVAKAFGIKSVKIDSSDLLEKQITEVLETNEAVLCEVMVEKEYDFSPKLSAKKLEDGTMISPSLEDMFPFLDREEIEGNVY